VVRQTDGLIIYVAQWRSADPCFHLLDLAAYLMLLWERLLESLILMFPIV